VAFTSDALGPRSPVNQDPVFAVTFRLGRPTMMRAAASRVDEQTQCSDLAQESDGPR